MYSKTEKIIFSIVYTMAIAVMILDGVVWRPH